MGRLLLGCFLIFSVFDAVACKISDLRLCGDAECKDPVSKGVTVLKYPSNDKDILSFSNNAQVIVYSKEAGTRPDLWGVEIQGKRGYAPHKYIRELKIFKSKLEFEVPTEAHLKKDNNDDRPDPSEESHSQQSNTEEDSANHLPVTHKVAITAEDVEYNNLPPSIPTEHLQDEKTTSQTSSPKPSEQPEQDASEAVSSKDTSEESIVTQEEEEIVEEEEEEEEEEAAEKEDDETKEDENEEEEEEIQAGESQDSDAEETLEGEVIKSDTPIEVTEAAAAAADNSPQDSKKEENVTEDEDTVPSSSDAPSSSDVPSSSESVVIASSEAPTEAEPVPRMPVNPSEVKEKRDNVEESESLITLEPSSVSFEVIDGTTLYFDEDVDTTPTSSRESQTVHAPPASLVLDGAGTSVPIHAMLHHSPPTSPSNVAQVEDRKAANPETPPSEAVESLLPHKQEIIAEDQEVASDTLEPVASITDEGTLAEADLHFTEENNSLTEESEPPSEGDESTKQIDIDDFASLLTENKEKEEAVPTTEESQSEFGAPKVETIIETSEAPDDPVEKPVESEGFFASWFGSSETTDDPPELEEIPEIPNPSESEASLDDTVDVESKSSDDLKDMEDSDAETASNDTDSPSDDISVPLIENESANTIPQVPNDTDVPESASNSSPFNQSSVESDSASDMEPSGDVPPLTPSNASSTHSVNDTTEATKDTGDSVNYTAHTSDEDTLDYLDDGRTEPGASTAEAMYAEPEPTSQSYTHSNVDPDELARLAAAGQVDGGDTKDDLIEESLVEKFLKASHSLLPEGMAFGVEAEVAEPEISQGALVFLSIVVLTVVSIYVVHLIMMKLSRENPILEALNTMDREKRLLQHENVSLHEELCKAHAELKAVTSRITESSGNMNDLDTQLELVKNEHAAETAQQEEKISQLEHELEEATNNSLEMHKMLSEMLSAQKDTSTFQASVDHLQEMLDGQQEKVEALNSDLALKTRLNEELHLELSSSREQVTKLDAQVQQLTQSLKELSSSKEEINQQLLKDMEVVKDLQDVNESLSKQSVEYDEQLSDLKHELKTLQSTIANLRESVQTKDSELQVAKECLKKLQLTSGDSKVPPDDEKLSTLFNVITIKAELQRVIAERINLEDQLRESEMAQNNLEDAMSSIQAEVTDLRVMHDEALREKQDAMSKLAVLTQYFEEKEAQLTKELESQEGLRMNAEGTAASVAHKIHNYELEVASYKAQVQSLQKELQNQEKSYKTQLDSCEKKAHDNWIQARAAERKHEEQRQENSQLRNRLTMIQKEREDMQGSILKPTPKRLDANGRLPSPGIEGEVDGEHSESPPHPLHGPPSVLPMMLPPGAPLPPGIPPPHGFPGVPPPPPPPGMPRGVPPFHPGEFPFMRPPLPPLPGDRRLPPAGGMSSPPFRRSGSPSYSHRNDRYSPSSDHSHLSDRHYSPPPLRHRPPSPNMHRRNHSPDRRSDRLRSPDRRSDRVRTPPDHHRSTRRTLDRRSPDRHFSTRSPDGYHRQRSSPHDYYDHSDYNSDDSRLHQTPNKGKKTSTPLGSSDRWRNDV